MSKIIRRKVMMTLTLENEEEAEFLDTLCEDGTLDDLISKCIREAKNKGIGLFSETSTINSLMEKFTEEFNEKFNQLNKRLESSLTNVSLDPKVTPSDDIPLKSQVSVSPIQSLPSTKPEQKVEVYNYDEDDDDDDENNFSMKNISLADIVATQSALREG